MGADRQPRWGREIGDANTAIMSFLTPPAPKQEGVGGVAGGAGTPAGGTSGSGAPETLDVKTVFARMPEAFRPEKAAGVNVVFQFSISGPGGVTGSSPCRMEPARSRRARRRTRRQRSR